jgi:hypothetical protein
MQHNCFQSVRGLKALASGLLLVLVLSLPSFAQEVTPKAEVFGGFSLLNSDAGTSRESLWGWQGAVNGNLSRSVGLVADFGGQYKNVAGVGLNYHQFTFGPRVFVRGEKVTPFFHFLGGAARASAAGFSDTGLALAVGGGLDLNVSDRFAVRVPQFDWTPTKFSGAWSTSEVRLGFGIVVRAGQK